MSDKRPTRAEVIADELGIGSRFVPNHVLAAAVLGACYASVLRGACRMRDLYRACREDYGRLVTALRETDALRIAEQRRAEQAEAELVRVQDLWVKSDQLRQGQVDRAEDLQSELERLVAWCERCGHGCDGLRGARQGGGK
jgi:hypothetical protein